MDQEPITTQSRKRGFNNERKEKEEGQHFHRIRTNHIVLLSLSNFLPLFLFLPSDIYQTFTVSEISVLTIFEWDSLDEKRGATSDKPKSSWVHL